MAERIVIQTPDGPAQAFLSQPDGPAVGGVLFFMDAFGLRPRIAEMTDLFASWGLVVLAPNVFHRDGDIDALAPTEDLRDPDYRARYFAGARLAVRTAGHFAGEIAAVGGFHGGGLCTADADSPHRMITGTRASYLFLHADGDRSMTPAAVAELEQTLTAADVPHVNEIVPGAPHGYTMSDTAAWHPQAYERHVNALQDLFDRTLRS